MSPLVVKLCNRLGLLPYLHAGVKKKILDTKFVIPLLGNLGFNNLYPSEPWMMRLLQQLKPLYNGYFTDIGINMGQTLLKAYAVYGNVKYTGFEPNPICVYYVQELKRMNNLNDCTIIPVGVNNSTGILKLHFYIENASDPSASIIEGFREGEIQKHSMAIPVFDSQYLLSFLPSQKHTLVKIDVEGAEPDVLEGLNQWITETEPIMLMEILPVYDAGHKDRLQRQERLEKLLKQMSYQIFRVCKTDPVSLLPLEEIGIHGNMEDCEYILCPQKLSGSLLQCFPTAARKSASLPETVH